MNFSPQLVPTVPSEIDWGHPLARGLLSLYVPGLSLGDFTPGGPSLAGGSAATIAPTPHGPGYADQVINNGAAFAACPAKLKIAGPMTLLLRLYQISTMGGTSGGPLWGVQHDIANGAPFFDLALGSLANGQVFLACNDGAGGTLFTGFDFACAVGALSNVVGVYLPGGSSSCYLNGGLNGTAVATPSQTAFGGADLLTLGSAGAAEFIQPNLASLEGAIWGRALSADEITWLDVEPFAMLRPIKRHTTFAPLDSTIHASLIRTTSPASLAAAARAAIAASVSTSAGAAVLAASASVAIAASLATSTAAATLASAASNDGIPPLNASLVRTTTAASLSSAASNANPTTLGLRETVMQALFARMQTLPGMTSYSRRMTLPHQVPPGDQPALMQWEQPELARNQTGLPDKRVWEAWIIIVFTNDDPAIPGATIINPMLDAMENALAVDDYGRNVCSLGGLVHYARIEGTIIKETGDTDTNGLGGAVIPIKIMPP